ncbi:MAG TPA: pre-peptidase C-terminal domain-containing protein [Rubricoccaceae bacterium]
MPRLFLLALLLAASAASAQTRTGTLERGDTTLESGEFTDSYEVRVRAGQTVSATVTSDDFDTYVFIKDEAERQEDNDDCTEGDTRTACVSFTADAAGIVRVVVTSYAPGETGDYRVEITTDDSARGGAGRGDGADRATTDRGGASGTGRGAATGETLQSGRRTAGALGRPDATLSSGEFVDSYAIEVRAGQRLGITLTSDDFDTYLLVTRPSGEQDDNDDCEPGQTDRSCLDVVADESGTWRVAVTSYQPGESGDYALTATVGSGTASSGTRGGVQPVSVRGDGARYESGSLARGDAALSTGEFADTFTFEGTGETVTVDLRSRGFDSYLIVRGEGGEQSDNDDYEGALDRSLVVVETRRGQTYTATVTSYAANETGNYDLTIQGEGGTGAVAPGQSVAGATRTETGRLERSDETLRSGEFVDTYTFQGTPGQRLAIDLTSSEFDTYLVVEPPRGETVEDDDGGGETGHSRLEMDLTEPGEYTVYVTSYAAAETGAYRLAIDGTERFGQPASSGRGGDGAVRPASTPGRGAPSRATQPATRQIADWTLSETFQGELDARDQRLPSGEYTEVHTFDGDAGEPVRIEMASDDFDTYLFVESPSGEQVDNDDFEGSQNRSVVEFTMPESGRYKITATSYRADEAGAYTLRISQADAMRPDPPAFDRIVGVFAGISDYGGRIGNLDYTAADAVLVRDAMIAQGMRPEDGILLQDADATVEGMRDAFERIARTADAQTMFVFFYSGHGGQYPRASAERADPDGLDESIELYDAEILDDDFDRMLAGIPSSRMMIVLDACYSGGFAKDVISSPGRMGLFSSEEDVVSAVAVKFEAGGYLSRFFADAAETVQADEDANGAVTALELSQYLHTRYNQDVTGTGRELIVARDTRPEHQKLIVDRGSVGLYDTLFQLGR